MSQIITCKHNKKRVTGMTLIESLIVVSIISITSAIVYPSYTKYVLRAHRAQAMADMVKIQLELEKTYNSGTGYNTSLSTATLRDSDPNRYSLTLTDTDVYTITATPINTQSSDSCGTLTLNEKGQGLPAECW